MKALKCAVVVACVGLAIVESPVCAAPFVPGDLVIYRVGDGSTLVNTGNAVFLDEYTPGGAFVQSVPMPTSANGANHALFASGTAQTEGLLTLSGDGRYLMLTGYASTTTGTATALKDTKAADVNRVVGRVDCAGNIDTTTALSDFSTKDTPRSVASTNGADLWVTGNAGGVRYTTLGSTTSTSLATLITSGYQVNVFGGQLYVGTHSNSKLLDSIGSGLPTTAGQGISVLLPAANGLGNPDAFYFADVDPATPGLDTLYVADDSTGIMKYCLSGTAWVYEGSQGTGSDGYRGLTGTVEENGDVLLYATRKGGGDALGGGELVSFEDTSGFNATMAGSFNLLGTAPAGTAFRGVAFAPAPEPSTLGLLAAAVFGLLGWRFVRRKS